MNKITLCKQTRSVTKLGNQQHSFDHIKEQERLNQSNQSNKNHSQNHSCDHFITLHHSIRLRPTNDNDKTDSISNQMNCHLFDFITQGVFIINQNQKVQYMNRKCFVLFQKQNEEQVLNSIKESLGMIPVNSDLEFIPNQSPKIKIQLTQSILEDIMLSQKENGQKIDVFDIILNQRKHLRQYYKTKGFSDNEKSTFEESPLSQKKQNVFKFIMQIFQTKQVRLKIIHCVSQNSLAQGAYSEQQPQGQLVVVIKNITQKKKLKQLTEKFDHHINMTQNLLNETQILHTSSLSLLNHLKQRFKGHDSNHQIKNHDQIHQKDNISLIQAQNQLLYHQLSNLKDIIAIEHQTFQYSFESFFIKEIILDFEKTFLHFMTFKGINFSVKVSEQLQDKIIHSDKQRIIQVIDCLVYFFLCKAQQAGEMVLAFQCLDETVTQISIVLNEPIIEQNEKNVGRMVFKKKDCNQNKKIKPDICCVLNLSAQLVEGLIETNDNYIEVTSSQSGSRISFWIQNLDFNQQKEQIQVRNLSSTGKFVNLTRSGTQKDENIIIRRLSNYISEHNHDSLVIKSEAIKSNESPNCYDDYNEKIIIPQANYFQFKSLESPSQLIINKTFSFKVQTLQAHECTQVCIKILIVDEQIVNLITLRQLLSYYQIQCDFAFNGNQAITKIKEKIQSLCQFYHIIFINPCMKLKEINKQLIPLGGQKQNFVLLTEKNQTQNKYFDDNTNYCEVLEKPVSQLELHNILKNQMIIILTCLFTLINSIEIYVNTLRPKDNPSETYSYYTLPYCQPEDAEQIVETLGQSLSGDQKMTSFYSFNSSDTIKDKKICTGNYTEKQLKLFQDAIDQNYIIEFYLGDFTMHDIVGKFYKGSYYLKNRITFNLYVNKEKVLIFANITQNDGFKEFTQFNSETQYTTVNFYFTVNLIQAEEDLELFQHDHSIKWSLLIFKNFVILVLIIVVCRLLRRTLLSDYSNLPDEDEENESEAQGWKAYKVEALMPPKNRIIFSALLGTGTHLLTTILVVLILGAFDLFETHKGSVKSAGIIIYSFAGTLNGYYTGKFYKFYGGKSWLLNLFIAAVVFPISALSVFFIVDAFGFLFGTTATFSFSAVFSIGFILTVVYLPLTLIGGVSGRLRTIDELYEKRLKKKLLTNDLVFLTRGLAFGAIPFISIIFELYYVLESTWSDQFFEYYSLLIFSYFQLIIIVGCLSVIQTYNQLKNGNYNWQWISFINGGFFSIYIFIFSFFYYYFVNMHGFFQFLSYFAENILVCFAIWLMFGFVSYWVSLKFVIYIYAQNKIQ